MIEVNKFVDEKTVSQSSVSHIFSLKLGGYPGKMLTGNIKNWSLSVLDTNPGILDQLREGPEAFYIKNIINDENKYLEETRQRIAVDKYHGFEGKRSLMITNFKENTDKYTEYDISKVPGSVPECEDTDGICFYVDASNYGEGNFYIGAAIKSGNTVSYYVNENGEAKFTLPAGYKGFVFLKNSDNLINKCEKFLLCVPETAENKYHSIFFSDFYFTKNGEKKGNFFNLNGLALGETNNRSGWEMVVWFNEYSGKMLTGISLQYMTDPDEKLKAVGDRITNELSEIQKDDGYLGIYPEETRLGRNQNWDIWGHYHQIYGLISWYRVTGNDTALKVAIKAADCIINEFYAVGRSMDEFGENQHVNFSTTHAFAELYKITGDKKYLDVVLKNVNEQWPNSGNWLNMALSGEDFYKSKLPRWESLHPVLALATLYEITGDKKYFKAFENIIKSIKKTDIHITGAFSTVERAQGTIYIDGPVETCCSVAWNALLSKYSEFSKDSTVADELERSYFNEIFGSLLDGERLSTYDTQSEGDKRIAAWYNFRDSANFFFHSGAPEFTCCQANIARGLGEIATWAVTTSEKYLYLNYIGDCEIQTTTPKGQKIVLEIRSDYPNSGKILINIKDLKSPEIISLSVRIPEYSCISGDICLNGGNIIKNKDCIFGNRFELEKQWTENDSVEFDLNSKVNYFINEKDNNLSAVYYGPILLSAVENSENSLKDVNFNESDFNNLKAEFADDGKHWMKFTVNKEGKDYIFYDFASIGKFDAYKTWFKVNHGGRKI